MRINNLTQQQQEDEFSHNLSYEEWLRDNIKEPSDKELQKMEKIYSSGFVLKKSDHHYYPLVHPINHIDFQPLKGA